MTEESQPPRKNIERLLGQLQKFVPALRGIGVLSIIFVCSVIAVILHLSRYPIEVAESVAIEDAEIYTRALSSFRTLYTKLVVQPARERGTEITHDVFKKGNTMPLPATMTRLIGEEMARAGHGGEAYLYSPYPFPWRKQEGGLKDQFAKDAWEALNKDPSKAFSRFEDIGGIRTLRYATADVMRQSCVQCHNSYPQTPRIGWREGDVRGVLEVRRPVEKVVIQASNRAKNILWMVVSIGISGLIGLIAMILLIRHLKSEITARVKAEHLIREQQAMLVTSAKMSALGEMAGGVAHEINTPLAVISMRVEQMEECIRDGDLNGIDFVEGLDIIRRTTDRIAKIVSGLRFFAREGRQVRSQTVKVSALIEDTLGFCGERLANHGIILDVERRDDFESLKIECQAVEISQVILNLLNNAFDAIEQLKEKWIKIKVTDLGENIEISVTDSGSGLSKEVRDKIMQPFFTTKEIGKGTGLGLSISKGIINSHQGKLSVDDKCANTKFVILLPKQQKEPA
jgi:signal transduction histidine kinase